MSIIQICQWAPEKLPCVIFCLCAVLNAFTHSTQTAHRSISNSFHSKDNCFKVELLFTNIRNKPEKFQMGHMVPNFYKWLIRKIHLDILINFSPERLCFTFLHSSWSSKWSEPILWFRV